jgi:hypothetical protein
VNRTRRGDTDNDSEVSTPNGSGGPSVNSLSVYQQAIDATIQTIRLRAQRYRNLVVAVAVTLVVSILTALVTWSWHPLLGLTAIVLWYGAFALGDARLALAWQRRILDLWANQQLDLRPLRDALKAIPAMPVRTLDGMLTMLPTPTAATSAETRSGVLRRATAVAAHEAHAVQQVQALLTASLRLITVISLVLALTIRSVIPLASLLAIPLLLGIAAMRRELGRRRWRFEIAAARTAGVDAGQLRRQLEAFQRTDAFAPFIRQVVDTGEQAT